MLLRDLVARPELGLRVLHAGADALDRPLRWVYTTDLPDPGRYLAGGELVASGLVWRSGPADSEVFVAALARAGVAALAAGEAVFHGVPDDLLDACRRHDVPLLAVPEEVSFGALTEIVVGQLGAARGDRLALSLGRQRRLLSAVAGGLGLDGLAAQVSAETGRTCRVLTATGRVVAGPPLLPPGEAEPRAAALAAAHLTADRFPATVPGGGIVAAVGPATGTRLTGWFMAVDPAAGPSAPLLEPDALREAVDELAAFAALDRASRREGARIARAIADDAVALLAAGAPRPETSARLRQAGLDPAAPLVAVVVELAASPSVADPAAAAATVLVDATGGPAAVAGHDGRAAVLLPADAPPGGPEPAAVLVAALRRLAPGLRAAASGAGLAVGVSGPSPLDALAGALQEAHHACDLAVLRPEPVAVVTAADGTSHVTLLAAVPDDVRRAFAARVLGPVLAHDARTGGGLLGTLEAFLGCDGSWSRTAAVLHLHVNTVRYRIGRVEQLTGRDLGLLTDRVDTLLALRSHRPATLGARRE